MFSFSPRRYGVVAFLCLNAGCGPVPNNGDGSLHDTDMPTTPGTDSGTDTAPEDRSGLPILFSLHLEAKTARRCDDGIAPRDCASDQDWQANMDRLDHLIDSLDSAGLKGTFQHQIQWLQRLEDSPEGQAITQKMLDNGHEIGLHHHGWGHGDPDGYTNITTASGPLFLGDMDDYLDILHDWEDRWNYQLVTIEGTDLTLYDNQPEWLYRTSDDQHSLHWEDLDDEFNLCHYADGTGKPAWRGVTLPSTATKADGFTKVGHTYFGKGEVGVQGGAACQQVYADHILVRTKTLLSDGVETTDAVNMVFHPDIDYGLPHLTPGYDDFFQNIAEEEGVIGMTVRDYMCERVGVCE
jgi:hypothetical protein